jgi:hypothetical protein
VDIVTNAKLVVSSIQDVARKLGDYAKIVSPSTNSGKFDRFGDECVELNVFGFI